MRRPDGRETWYRLLEWDKGQAPSERLAVTLLGFEGFKNIDPSHPLGGKDGGKDAVLTNEEGIRLILAVYFPRGQQLFKIIENKFNKDLLGVKKNNANGIIFFTNQELTLSQRSSLINKAGSLVEIYHLERITNVLNLPQSYGLRLEFLNLEMTTEEILAFYKQRDSEYLNKLQLITDRLENTLQTLINYTTGGNSYPRFSIFKPENNKAIEFVVAVEGKFPLYDTKLKIRLTYQDHYLTTQEAIEAFKKSESWDFELSTLVPHYSMKVGSIKYPNKFPAILNIDTYTRNGFFHQKLILDFNKKDGVFIKSIKIANDIYRSNILYQFDRDAVV